MITGIIAVIILIAVLPPAINNGEWGVVAIAVVAALVVLGLGAASRQQDRAYGNMLRFWDTGELPGEHRKQTPTRHEKAGHVSRREQEEAARRREAYRQERMRQTQEWGKAKPETGVCHYCGRFVEISGSSKVQTPEGIMREFRCPKCGLVNYTKLGN